MSSDSACRSDRLSVVFVHPDLGIGGAERLVVDSASALQRRGHRVSVWTAHHDRSHCFPETRHTLAVQVRGDWLPRSVCGGMRALCAWLRVLYVCVCVAWSEHGEADVFVCDQVALAVPLLRWLVPRARVIFYCHFPDLLLSGERHGLLKRCYRRPLDWLEEWCTGVAHHVFVNSRFTEQVFRETFLSLASLPVQVLHPALNGSSFDHTKAVPDTQLCQLILGSDSPSSQCPRFILSLNRYERKKNVVLAVDTLALLLDEFSDLRLVIAGGYDRLSVENVQHYAELARACESRGVSARVTMLRSPDDALKRQLLRKCSMLLYTPSDEHFGIVPLEAMYSSRPVVAVDSGGPRETVQHELTGLLCPATAESFSEAAARLLREPELADRMGIAGKQRVQSYFSLEAFAEQLDEVVRQVVH